MSTIPDTPKTLLDDLARGERLDEFRWRQFDEIYRPVVACFLCQRFGSLAHESEDLAQDVMVRLIEILREGKYDSSRARFRTFLRVLVANTAIDRIRRLERFKNIQLDTLDWTGNRTSSIDLKFLDRQWAESCYRAARQHVLYRAPMDNAHREIYLALERGEKTHDVAQRFGVTDAAARQMRHRISSAIDALASELASETSSES